MRLVCPECKNDVNLTSYPEIAQGTVVECNHCGITLEINEIGENVTVEIVDEGK